MTAAAQAPRTESPKRSQGIVAILMDRLARAFPGSPWSSIAEKGFREEASRPPRPPLRGWGWEILLLAGALLVCNLHLMGIGQLETWIFRPGEVGKGEWWRMLTHPFTHLSGYHLVLDGAAFFLLYAEFRPRRPMFRAGALLFCAGGSLLAAWLGSPQVAALGLCGLSGTAHGLMALSGLNQMRSLETRRAGGVAFGLVASKCIIEGLTGEVLFAFMHMGLCGTPIAMAHLGGVAGGIAAHLLGEVIRPGHRNAPKARTP